MEEDNERKKLLMYICEKINSCSEKAVSIMRSKPINSLKVISRNARDVKDPNPLQTMLMTLSTPFPLSLDRKKAIKSGMPMDLIRRNKEDKEVEDNHYKGRILAKYSALDWWIGKSPEPSKTAKEIVDMLTRKGNSDLDTYNSIAWERSKLVYGRCPLERTLVATKKVEVHLSRETREELVKRIFVPDDTIPYVDIPDSILKRTKEIVDGNIHGNMMLATQIRILANQLNPQFRYLPVPPGSTDTTSTMRHAICQSNWIVEGIEISEPLEGNEMKDNMVTVCDMALHCLHEDIESFDLIINALKSARLFGMSLSSLVKNQGIKNTEGVKFVKAALGIEFVYEHEFFGVKFCPDGADRIIETVTRMPNFDVYCYLGKEKVYFQHEGTKGFFTHNSDAIYTVTTNFISQEETRTVIAAIAVYCRKELYKHREKETLGAMYKAVFERFQLKPWELFADLRQGTFWKVLRGEQVHKILILKEDSEYQVTTSSNVGIDLNPIRIRETVTGHKVQLHKPRKLSTLPMSLELDPSPFDNYLDPKRRLERKFYKYFHDFERLRTNILSNNFNWDNSSIHALNNSNIAIRFARLCRETVNSLITSDDTPSNRAMISFCYCFAGLYSNEDEDEFVEVSPSYQWVEGLTFSLLGDEGQLILSNTGVYLFGKNVTTVPLNRFEMYHSILPGYVIHPYRGDNLRIVTKQFLRDKYKHIATGEKFIIHVDSKRVVARKDETFGLRVVETVRRQCRERSDRGVKRVADEVLAHLSGKRRK